MKKRTLLIISLLLYIMCILMGSKAKAQNIGINSNGATPNSSAMLDIDISALASKKGLLIPRLTAAQKTAMNPLPAAAQGLIVYQTDGVQGFYYNTSTTTTPSWNYLLPSGSAGWSLSGNAGTTPISNFIGTTDVQDLAFKANNQEVMRVTTGTKVGINESNPSSTLQVRTYANGMLSTPYDGIKIQAPAAAPIYNTGTLLGIEDGSSSGTMGRNAQLWNFEPGFLRFGTADQERLRINQFGSFGFNEPNAVSTITMRPFINGPTGASFDGLRIIHPSDAPSTLAGVILGVDPSGQDATVTSYQTGNLTFGTNGQERMRITPMGNVAIGVTNPSSTSLATLVIKDNIGIQPGMMVIDPAYPPGTQGLFFGLLPSGGGMAQGKIWNYMTGDIQMGTNGTELVRLSSNGHVGIRNPAPAYDLDVNGVGNFSNGLRVTGYTLPNGDGSANQVITTNGSGTLSWTNQSGGTVNSVDLFMPSVFSVSGGPITGSGAFNVNLQNEPANMIFAGPSSGGASQPAFRALVAADLPTGATGYIQNNAVNSAFATGQAASFDITGNGEINGTLNVNGNMGIGTLTPGAKLDVAGKIKTQTFQMTTGATANYVMIADAAGNGTWQAMPSPATTGWGLTGNSGTVAGTNFIGTTDAADLVIERNNDEGMRLTAGAAILATGNSTTGITPSSGAGRRMMWIPAKSAFRAGEVIGTEWDDANIGNKSIALGIETKASGYAAVAIGEHNWATGGNATALGWSSTASGNISFAIGFGTMATNTGALSIGYSNLASGAGSTAIGNSTTSSADTSLAIGNNLTASGPRSSALGNYASTAGFKGSLVIGDYSTLTACSSTAINQFKSRFAGGYIFHTDAALSTAGTVVFNSGNVGVGTLAPANKLDVAGSIRTGGAGIDGQLQLYSEQGATDYTYTINPNASATQNIVFTLPPNDGNANEMLMTDGAGNLSWNSATSSAWSLTGNLSTNDPAIPAIYGTTTIAAGENYMGSADGQDVVMATNGIERLRIRQTTGNIGIGTSSPTERLHVAVTSDVNKTAIYGNANQTSGASDFQNTGVTGFGQGNGIAGGFGYGFGVKGVGSINSYGAVGVYASLGSAVPVVTLANNFYAMYADAGSVAGNKYAGVFMNGNVGIGTTAPNALMDISGTTKVGTLGSVLTNIIKSTNTVDVGSVAANSSLVVTYAVANTATTSSVAFSPATALANGLLIAYARVSAAGTVEVKFTNVTGAPIDPPSMDYYITVIR